MFLLLLKQLVYSYYMQEDAMLNMTIYAFFIHDTL